LGLRRLTDRERDLGGWIVVEYNLVRGEEGGQMYRIIRGSPKWLGIADIKGKKISRKERTEEK